VPVQLELREPQVMRMVAEKPPRDPKGYRTLWKIST
jgi:hypothetical protein